MPRFVILYHQMPSESQRSNHWDLMLEDGNHLTTWELPMAPIIGNRFKVLPLADHRLKYLSYEGPLTENRGSVTRYDWGRYKMIFADDTQQIVVLYGQNLIRRVTIEKILNSIEETELRIDSETINLKNPTGINDHEKRWNLPS